MYGSAWNCCGFPISNVTMGRAKYSPVLVEFLTTANASASSAPTARGSRRSCVSSPASTRHLAVPSYGRKVLKLGYLAQGVADETESTLHDLVDAALARATHEESGVRNKALRTMLSAFGFAPTEYDRPLRSFSGGQRAKVALTHVLIDEPDYLILDEPTNHLDVATIRWLESFVSNDPRGYIVVSHDRYFLDRIATRIWEIERGRFHAYAPERPAYTAYVAAKEVRLEAERREYETFVVERDKRRRTIAGLRATHTSSDYSQVRSREKQLARIEATTRAPSPAASERQISVRLRPSRRAGSGFAFEARGLSKAYDQQLFSGLAIDVERGERLGIVGPNGSGKSTLLKILTGAVQPDSGSVVFNPAAQVAYFAQNSHDQLDVRGERARSRAGWRCTDARRRRADCSAACALAAMRQTKPCAIFPVASGAVSCWHD